MLFERKASLEFELVNRVSPILAQFSLPKPEEKLFFLLHPHIRTVPGTLWRAAALDIRNRYEIVRSFVCFDRLPSKEGVLELPGWRMSMPISFGLTVFRKLFWNDIGVRDIRFQSTY